MGTWLRRYRKIVAVVIIVAVFAFIVHRFQTPVGKGLVWEEYKPYKVEVAKQKGLPIVIDFSAEWCIACKELDRFVFHNPQVTSQLESFVRLRVDSTDMNSPRVQQAADAYNIEGLPTVIFINARGEEVKDARVVGSVSSAEFLQSLKKARE